MDVILLDIVTLGMYDSRENFSRRSQSLYGWTKVESALPISRKISWTTFNNQFLQTWNLFCVCLFDDWKVLLNWILRNVDLLILTPPIFFQLACISAFTMRVEGKSSFTYDYFFFITMWGWEIKNICGYNIITYF